MLEKLKTNMKKTPEKRVLGSGEGWRSVGVLYTKTLINRTKTYPKPAQIRPESGARTLLTGTLY